MLILVQILPSKSRVSHDILEDYDIFHEVVQVPTGLLTCRYLRLDAMGILSRSLGQIILKVRIVTCFFRLSGLVTSRSHKSWLREERRRFSSGARKVISGYLCFELCFFET